MVFVWQGYESPCSDKPPSLILWSESLAKTHPWPPSNILFFIKAGFPASVSLGCLETDRLEGCSIDKCFQKHCASFFIKGIASPIRQGTIGAALILDLNERDFLDPLL